MKDNEPLDQAENILDAVMVAQAKDGYRTYEDALYAVWLLIQQAKTDE